MTIVVWMPIGYLNFIFPQMKLQFSYLLVDMKKLGESPVCISTGRNGNSTGFAFLPWHIHDYTLTMIPSYKIIAVSAGRLQNGQAAECAGSYSYKDSARLAEPTRNRFIYWYGRKTENGL